MAALREHLRASPDAHQHDLVGLVDSFRRRHADALGEWIFPTTRLTLRDPDNTRARLRDVVRGTPWEGPHPHAFRHLVVTRLEPVCRRMRSPTTWGTSGSP